MNIREIELGGVYNTEIGSVRVFHLFFNEEWDEWCIQAKLVVDGRNYTFVPEDLEGEVA